MLPYLVPNVVTKHANDSDLLGLDRISEVNPLFSHKVSNHNVHFKMFQHYPKANCQPNGGRYLQIMSGKDLYKQTMVVSIKGNDTFSSTDTFKVSFVNIFVDYPLGEMQIGNKSWMKWNKAPLRLWQAQLNLSYFAQ